LNLHGLKYICILNFVKIRWQKTEILGSKVSAETPYIKKNLRSEIQNSLTISGLPRHKLVLKVNSIVLLIRNVNTKEALDNGTRMRIKFIHRNAIDCEVLTGTARNKRNLIPRINLTYSYFTI
jgi:hypothetical protein